MRQEERSVRYDEELNVEIYRFRGIMQKFPCHFHDHYVVGLVEEGRRRLVCRKEAFFLEPGHMVLFNPFDDHGCEPLDDRPLTYGCLNLPRETMARLIGLSPESALPRFASPVVADEGASRLLQRAQQALADGASIETRRTLLERVAREILLPRSLPQETEEELPDPRIERICDYIDSRYSGKIDLDTLSDLVRANKYHLLRAFSRAKGVTPYRYVQTVRINRAKNLIRTGRSLSDVAFETGFSDQSHFSSFFKNFIGITPKKYKDLFQRDLDA